MFNKYIRDHAEGIIKQLEQEATLSGLQVEAPEMINGPVFCRKYLHSGIKQQMEHMRSEMVEVEEEFYKSEFNVNRFMSEIIDVQNSAETLLHIVSKLSEVDIDHVRKEVFDGLVTRGYNPGYVGQKDPFKNAASDEYMNDLVGRAIEKTEKELSKIDDSLKAKKQEIDDKCKLNYDKYRVDRILKPVQKYKHPIPEYGKPLPGISPDAPVVKNTAGGSQSESIYDFTDVNPLALLRIAARSAYGQKKYGRNNWAKITSSEHFNHGMIHMVAYMVGDRSDDHLGAMGWRILAGIAVAMKEESEKG